MLNVIPQKAVFIDVLSRLMDDRRILVELVELVLLNVVARLMVINPQTFDLGHSMTKHEPMNAITLYRVATSKPVDS